MTRNLSLWGWVNVRIRRRCMHVVTCSHNQYRTLHGMQQLQLLYTAVFRQEYNWCTEPAAVREAPQKPSRQAAPAGLTSASDDGLCSITLCIHQRCM
jgi:hypothetical protein